MTVAAGWRRCPGCGQPARPEQPCEVCGTQTDTADGLGIALDLLALHAPPAALERAITVADELEGPTWERTAVQLRALRRRPWAAGGER